MQRPALRHRPLDLKLRHAFGLSRGTWDSRKNLLVELDDGRHVGLGEAAPIARYGQDQESSRRAVEEMHARLGDPRAFAVEAARVAVPGQAAAQAALDIALHDLAGKRLGAPLYELLGVDRTGAPETSFTIGLDTPEKVVAKVREASAYPILKVKMGSDADRAVLEAVRDTTRQRLRVDANEGWTLEGALERLEWLERLGVEMVEQPLPADQIEQTRELRKRSPLPIWADESVHGPEDVPRLAGAFDGINIKLMKCGGVAAALRLIAVARAHGLQVMLGCMIETAIGITAAAHLSPLVDTADLDGNLLLEHDPFEGVTLRDGRLVLPEGPGLGVKLRAD